MSDSNPAASSDTTASTSQTSYQQAMMQRQPVTQPGETAAAADPAGAAAAAAATGYPVTDQIPVEETKLFLGGLSPRTTEMELRTFCSQYGTVLHVSIIKDKVTSESRGFGFVTFVDPNTVTRLLATPLFLDGRQLQTRRAVPRDQIAKARHSVVNADLDCKLFVGALSQETSEAALRAYFEQFGQVTHATIMLDRVTGVSRGFGFVTMGSPADANRVLSFPALELQGRSLKVTKAAPKPPAYARTVRDPYATYNPQMSAGGQPGDLQSAYQQYVDAYRRAMGGGGQGAYANAAAMPTYHSYQQQSGGASSYQQASSSTNARWNPY